MSTLPPGASAPRQFKLLGVLGEGATSTVYQATLLGRDGFAKDVALKVARRDLTPNDLARLRDEARILGLLRDRAIVQVEPPIILDGRVTLVMEFVEGANLNTLLERGPLPPRAALEIVAEVARALDHAWQQPGPDGPLHLLHRDLSTRSIRVTPAGEVKILGFGLARADFANRESETVVQLGGSIGYIAPERLDGPAVPASDIFSLGITLFVALTGHLPTRRPTVDHLPAEALELARKMRAPAPADRPTAREVEELALAAAARCPGDGLRRWAGVTVPGAVKLGTDERIGRAFAEGYVEAAPAQAPAAPPPARRRGLALAAAGLASMVTLLALALVLLGGGGLALAWWWQQTEAPPEATPSLTATDPSELTLPPAPPEPPPAPAPEPEPEPQPPPAPAPGPASPAPRPTPSAPSRPASPAAATWPVTFSSTPLGAEVLVDGASLGKTPIIARPLPEGVHEVELRFGGEVLQRRITVGPKAPVRYVWRGGDAWESHF